MESVENHPIQDHHSGWSLVKKLMPLDAVGAIPESLIDWMSGDMKEALNQKYRESEDTVEMASYIQGLKDTAKGFTIGMEDPRIGFGVSTENAIETNTPVTVYLGSLLFTDYLTKDLTGHVDNKILVFDLNFSIPDDIAYSLTDLLVEKEAEKRRLRLARSRKKRLIRLFLKLFTEKYPDDHTFVLESLSYSHEIIKTAEFQLDVSAAYEGTAARYINHSDSSNCKARIRWHKFGKDGLEAWPFVEFYACRDILPGEFLSVDYGAKADEIFAVHQFVSDSMDKVFESA